MRYDFTSILDRSGRDALAVDGIGTVPYAPEAPREGFDAIPMWVADMNFPTVPSVLRALHERAEHPAFGYFDPAPAYARSILDWQERRNGVRGLKADWIGYENGVLGGVASALAAVCSRGDHVLLHTPAYIGFFGLLANNGYQVSQSPLYLDEQGIWRMDFADMEKRIAEDRIHAAILCSPHNPCGRVWERWELEAAYDIFRKYDVTVISDEIWSDLTLEGYRHLPSICLHEDARARTVALYAPSKTFNLAGLIGSYHIICSDRLRDRVRRAASLSYYNHMNVLSMHALIGAYGEEGQAWVDELRSVLTGNVRFAVQYIREHFPDLRVAEPQGTYMLFVDCREWCRRKRITLQELEKQMWSVGVACQDGTKFGGSCHVRMNLALPLSRVEEAMHRLSRFVFAE